jgi:uncharacterized cupredoxin-like copper-binding protein
MNKRYLLPLLIALALLLAACGGGEEEAGNETVTVSVKDEFNFDPATITVAPGDTVDITFENTGSVEHSFYILKPDAELEHVLGEEDEEHLHEELLFDIHEIAPGESASESFTAPDEPGDYTIACLLPGHADAGMVGTLRVTP